MHIFTQLVSCCFCWAVIFSQAQLMISFPEFQRHKHRARWQLVSMREFQSFNKTTPPPPPYVETQLRLPPSTHTHAHIGTKTPPAVFDLVKQCMISGKILIQVHRGERDNRQWTQVRECVGVEVEVEVGPHPLCDTSIWMCSYFLSVYCLFDCGHFTISTCFMSSVSILEHEWLWLMTRQLSGSLSSTL